MAPKKAAAKKAIKIAKDFNITRVPMVADEIHLRAEISRLNSQVEEFSKENAALAERVIKLDDENSKIVRLVVDKDEQVLQLNTQVAKLTETGSVTERENANYREENTDLRESVKNLENVLDLATFGRLFVLPFGLRIRIGKRG
jgi:cell division protein FtsB